MTLILFIFNLKLKPNLKKIYIYHEPYKFYLMCCLQI